MKGETQMSVAFSGLNTTEGNQGRQHIEGPLTLPALRKGNLDCWMLGNQVGRQPNQEVRVAPLELATIAQGDGVEPEL